MTRGLKKEFVEADLPLAMSCLASVIGVDTAKHLVPKFRDWVEYLQAQLKEYEINQ